MLAGNARDERMPLGVLTGVPDRLPDPFERGLYDHLIGDVFHRWYTSFRVTRLPQHKLICLQKASTATTETVVSPARGQRLWLFERERAERHCAGESAALSARLGRRLCRTWSGG